MLKVKEHLTTVLEELEWENLNVAQWKKLIFHQTNVTNAVISLCSCSFSSSSKLFICVVLVLVLVPSCLLV